MIVPSPTTPLQPGVARGVLLGEVNATATRAAYLRMGVPNTSYELHLRAVGVGEVGVPVGKRLIGIIRVEARRIDATGTGGKFIEPVMGRPRRVQGSVVGHEGNAVIVDAGVPIHLIPLDERQKAQDFPLGSLIGCDVMDGATFERLASGGVA